MSDRQQSQRLGRTGSLWGVRNIWWGPESPPKNNKEYVTILPKPPVTDNVWYAQEVICRRGLVTVKLDGQKMFDYRLPEADVEHKLPTGRTWLPRGTFALQGHPPMPGHISKACFEKHPRQGLVRLSRPPERGTSLRGLAGPLH